MVEKFAYVYKRCTCCKLSAHEYQFPFKKGSKTVRDFTHCLFCIDQCTVGKCNVRPITKKKAK